MSLERSLRSVVGDSRYQLVRTTPYVRPGTNHGTQGTRILYDTRKFRLLSNCPETTGSKNYLVRATSSVTHANLLKLKRHITEF